MYLRVHTGWRVAGTVLCGGLHCPSLSVGGKELLPRGQGGQGRWVFVNACQEAAVWRAWRCRELLDKWFPPLYPLVPVCWCLHLCEYASLSVHLCECLLAVWIPVFICHFGHRLAGLAGLADGELGGAQLLEVSNRACFRQSTAAGDCHIPS